MNREIKYRICDKELKELNYLSLEDLCGDDYWYDGDIDVWSVLYDCNNKNERFEINQYTGLKDKKDVEIYDGDILLNTASNTNYIVKFYDTKFMLNVIGRDEVADMYTFLNRIPTIFEIIGNIYDNPELIKK